MQACIHAAANFIAADKCADAIGSGQFVAYAIGFAVCVAVCAIAARI